MAAISILVIDNVGIAVKKNKGIANISRFGADMIMSKIMPKQPYTKKRESQDVEKHVRGEMVRCRLQICFT